MSLDMLGAVEIGEGWSDMIPSIFQAAGGITSGAIAMHEKNEAAKKLAADDKAKLDAAVSADITATNAAAKAEVSAALKQPSASTDKAAADAAAGAQARAGAKLSPAAAESRAQAIEKALNAAISASQANPKDGYKAALVKAWTATMNKAQNTAIVSSDDAPVAKGGGRGGDAEDSGGGGSWFSKKTGPVPNWGLAAGGAGVAALLVKKFVLK